MARVSGKKQSVVFLLPYRDEAPVGGYKIVYGYADLLARDGCDVHLVYPHVKPEEFARVRNPLMRGKMRLGFFYRSRIRGQFGLGNWYDFKGPVHREYEFTVEKNLPRRYPHHTVFVATAVETAYWLAAMNGVGEGNGRYFIQDFENWKHDDAYVFGSYRLPLKKAVISSWLKDKVAETGGTAAVIPDAVDSEYFDLSEKIESRDRYCVALLYHTDERKRTEDVLAALEIVRRKYPGLHALAFGVEARPDGLPSWYEYYRMPGKAEHNRIYNRAAVFVAASRAEGWGLTVCEAMQCGCAVACSDAGGFKEFCFDGETALVSPALDVEALARNVMRLIEDGDMRIRLAKAGKERMKNFTWESSFTKMKDFLGVPADLELDIC